MSPDLALSPTLIGSNYPCLELIFIVPKVFEPLKFDCSLDTFPILNYIAASFILNYWYLKVNFLGPENLLWDISSLG